MKKFNGLTRAATGGTHMRYFYQPMLRPAGFATLPKGLEWDYVEGPALDPIISVRRGIPLSKCPHGIIATRRPLTFNEIMDFNLEPIITLGYLVHPSEQRARKS